MAKAKKPRIGREPADTKRAKSRDVSTQGASPVWSFQYCDFGGPWCFKKVAGSEAVNLVGKLALFQKMTWGDIQGDHHHFLQPESIASKALHRLADIQQDDSVDQLFSFALGAKPRLIGIRRGRDFYVLWWDPHHEIAPSQKKHT